MSPLTVLVLAVGTTGLVVGLIYALSNRKWWPWVAVGVFGILSFTALGVRDADRTRKSIDRQIEQCLVEGGVPDRWGGLGLQFVCYHFPIQP